MFIRIFALSLINARDLHDLFLPFSVFAALQTVAHANMYAVK